MTLNRPPEDTAEPAGGSDVREPQPVERRAEEPLGDERRWQGLLLTVSVLRLATLVGAGLVVERSARTPLIQIRHPAPDFTLPATTGGVQSLAGARGRPVVLVFVPSVLCDLCRKQLRAVQAALPDLRTRGAAIFAVSTDTTAVQRAAADDLGLDYPLLSEAPTMNQHPAGSAYGVYHLAERQPGPVDANAIMVIDAAGIVRAVQVAPNRPIPADEILALAATALSPRGGAL